MEELEGVERFLMSGTRAAIVLRPDASLDERAVREALAARGLDFERFERRSSPRPRAAYVVVSPPVT